MRGPSLQNTPSASGRHHRKSFLFHYHILINLYLSTTKIVDVLLLFFYNLYSLNWFLLNFHLFTNVFQWINKTCCLPKTYFERYKPYRSMHICLHINSVIQSDIYHYSTKTRWLQTLRTIDSSAARLNTVVITLL